VTQSRPLVHRDQDDKTSSLVYCSLSLSIYIYIWSNLNRDTKHSERNWTVELSNLRVNIFLLLSFDFQTLTCKSCNISTHISYPKIFTVWLVLIDSCEFCKCLESPSTKIVAFRSSPAPVRRGSTWWTWVDNLRANFGSCWHFPGGPGPCLRGQLSLRRRRPQTGRWQTRSQ